MEKDIRLIRFENTSAELRKTARDYLLVRGRGVLRTSIGLYEQGEKIKQAAETQTSGTKKYQV